MAVAFLINIPLILIFIFLENILFQEKIKVVSRDKIKNFLFLFGYFLLLFLIACIFNIIAISNKNNFKEKPFILKEGRLKEAPEDFKNRKEKVKITFWHNLYDKEAAVLKKLLKTLKKIILVSRF